MRRLRPDIGRFALLGGTLACVLMLAAGLSAQQNQNKSASTAAKPDPALVAKGRQLFQNYHCVDCHGKNGEGTDDAPDLIGTHLDAAGIAKFLDKPSADASAKGMPNIEAGSDPSKALVAFVLSIKKGN